MTVMVRRRDLLAASLVVLLGACAGEGSDIGPRLPRLPSASTKVLLLDDQNRGVVSATVTVVGSGARARTGRNGRGDLFSEPRGRVLFDVDPALGAASHADTLGGYRVALSVLGTDLPMPLHVPDQPASSSVVIGNGTQGGQSVITSASGGQLTIPTGTTAVAPASVVGTSSTVRVSLGELSAQHLPGDLPRGGSGTQLFGRGYYIGPPEMTFTPGIDLDVPDDLSVTTPNAQLYRLDTETGEWQPVAFATASGGRLQVMGAITRGGLHAFGVSVPARTVSGVVVDANGNAVADARVKVDHLHTTTAGNGTFLLDAVPATLGDGTPRDAIVEVFAGALWLPVVTTTTAPYSADPVELGNIVLDTVRAGNVRVQQIVRARGDAFQPARFSSLRGDVALFTIGDENGQATFEDVPTGFFGYQEGRRRSRLEAYYGQQVGFLEDGRRWLDSYQFLFDRPWFQGTRSARAYVCDAIGGGPIEFADVVQGEFASEGYVGETRESGQLFAERGFRRRATATLRTSRGGATIVHGFSIELPNSDHLEFPMRRVLRQPLGMFDRHGLLTGSVTGVDAAAMHATRVTRRISRQELWDAVVEGLPIQSSLPIDVDIADTQDAFQVGMPAAGGNLSLVEFTSPGGKDTLQKAAVLADLRGDVVEGERVALADPVPLVAVTPFTLAGALTGAPSEVDPNTLTLSLGKEVPGAGVVDVARSIDGSVTAVGSDLQFGLPPLAAGELWLAMLGGSTSSGGVTSSHHAMIDLAATTTTGFVFQPFPTLTGPAPGATVPAAGFEVQFSLPAGCLGGAIELRSESGGELYLWDVLVRSDQPDFTFVTLPVEAETPLVAGRTYTLTVTAWFGEIDIATPDVYGDFVAYAQTIDLIEAGVRQVTRRSIQITTN
ncbi:MAG: carboxypeptidase regulatory-like domain-containing protein [Planctomycetes bacterium]|nr:carboxypeptidase regulatory-like domain-containing protein [Planctomycetota bacterium]